MIASVPRIHDSRRFTGANLLLSGPGAVLEIVGDDDAVSAAVEMWRAEIAPFLESLGWGSAERAVRITKQGASLAFVAPIDVLYAACEVNEAAWARVEAQFAQNAPSEPFEDALARLRQEIESERSPRLLELQQAAAERGLTFLWDDDEVSIGLGVGSRSWPTSELPSVSEIPWSELFDLPVVMVTGTNGKTTTVRLLGAIGRAAGKTPGFSSTDGIFIGDQLLDSGDYSGPGGARAVLRHREVDFPVLETARGGMQRRGLGIERAAAVAITNIAEDHLGEFGVPDLAALADVKFLVTRALGEESRCILCADDEETVARAHRVSAPIVWCTTRSDNRVVADHLRQGGEAYVLEDGELVHRSAGKRDLIIGVDDLPIALGGAARHNIANALMASALAASVGLPHDQIAWGLSQFKGDATDNPGRANSYEFGGIRAIADFAHNPHGQRAFLAMVQDLPAKRRLLILGQAGDRDDASIRQLARVAWEGRPDRIFIKEMECYLRGRERGEVPKILEEELRSAGAPAEILEHTPSELDAVLRCLAVAQPGDLLCLPLHAQRSEVLALLDERQREARLS